MPRTSAYLVAVASTLLATLFRLMLIPVIGQAHAAFTTYFIAIMITAWYGGLKPALAAVGLGAIFALYFFIEPFYTFKILDFSGGVRFGLYFITGFSLAFIGEQLQKEQRTAKASLRQARQEVEERRRAETALKASEQFARSILNGLSARIAVLDKYGNILEMNDTWHKFYVAVPQLTPLAHRGANYLNFFIETGYRPAVALPFIKGVMGVLSGEVESFEMEYGYPAETEEQWFVVRVTRVPDSPHIIVAHSDITLRKQAEQEITQQAAIIETVNRVGQILSSELELDRLVQVVVDAATDLSKAEFGAFFYNLIDDAGESYMLYAISGAPREAFADFPMPRNTEIFGPTFRGEAVVRLDNVRADPRYGKNAPYRGMPEGHLPVVSYLAVPVVSRSGEVLGGLFFGHSEEGQFTAYEEYLVRGLAAQAAVAMDNARLYTEVREQRRRLHTTLASIADGVISTDSAGNIDFINYVAQKLTGWTESQALGQPLDKVFILAGEAGDTPKVIDVTDVQEHIKLTPYLLLISRTERQIPVVPKISPIQGVNGENMGTVVVFRDVSRQKQAEEELAALALRLAQSNRELQDFAYIASHDLQEPLRKIRMFSDRFQTKYAALVDAQGRDYLQRIQSATERMQQLIQNLLMFSRIQTRGQPFVQTNLNSVLQEVLSDLEATIEQEQATVKVDSLPTLEADPLQMQQLFQNLLSNSLKYHRPDAPPVIQIVGKVTGGERAIIQVTDNGIGFEEAYAERIFGLFQRLHGRSEYDGTGIGLSICRRIIERHNGTIAAEGRPNEGATFTITLPLIQSTSSPSPID